MEWYWYYLIIGIYVAIAIYGSSIFYKVRHKDYVRDNPLITWKILYGFPFAVLIWWIIILGACYEIMHSMHLKQELDIIEFVKELKEE